MNITFKNTGRWALYLALALAFSLLQSVPGLGVIAGVGPLLSVCYVFCMAIFLPPVSAGVLGFIGGILWDISALTLPIGFCGALLLITCVGISLLCTYGVRRRVVAAPLIVFGATFLVLLFIALVVFVFFGITGTDQLVLRRYLPMALYTGVLSLPLYYLALVITKTATEEVS